MESFNVTNIEHNEGP